MSGYIPKRTARAQIGICTPVFTAALFPITKRSKQPKCSLMGEWINIMCIQWSIIQSLKMREILHSTTLSKFEDVMLNKISQIKGQILYDSIYMMYLE